LPALLPLPDSVVAMLDGSGPLGYPGGADASGSLPAGMAEMRDLAHGDVSDLRYEVMYFLEAPDDSVPAFREVWAGIGDSIVVVGGDGLWNCHIHTDDVGAA